MATIPYSQEVIQRPSGKFLRVPKTNFMIVAADWCQTWDHDPNSEEACEEIGWFGTEAEAIEYARIQAPANFWIVPDYDYSLEPIPGEIYVAGLAFGVYAHKR